MKLISLNAWCGSVFDPLINFIKQEAYDTDIFCFQEILSTHSGRKEYKNQRINLLQELQNTLPNFDYIYTPQIKGYNIIALKPEKVDFDLYLGLTIFYKNNIEVKEKGEYYIYKFDPPNFNLNISDYPIVLQFLTYKNAGKEFTIFNFHGAPYPGSKLDTDFRIQQSIKIKDYMKQFNNNKILIGDFNLMPNTKSITILEEDTKNLIKEYNISKTRGKLNPYYGKADFQGFADYAFVTKGIEVKNFEVPEVEISDHLPLIVTFS